MSCTVELNFLFSKGDSLQNLKDLIDHARKTRVVVYGTNAPNSISNLIIE
jgi:hypothetical protein